MEDLTVVPDDLLEMAKELEPQFPICTIDCISWKLEHQDCRGCKYFEKCKYFVLGLDVGTKRAIKKFKKPRGLLGELFWDDGE